MSKKSQKKISQPEKSPSKKHYPAEFREKAVKLITELGYTVEQVAEKLGCSKESVRRWIRKF